MLARLLVILLIPSTLAAAADQVLPARTRYASEIPTLKQSFGFDIGDEITSPEQIIVYLKALAAAVPAQTRLIEYARSWEGRPLHLLVIGSAPNITRLDQIRQGILRLADPRRSSPAEAERLVKDLPAVTWLLHAVHGNEISSSEAALALAYHLLAARQDVIVDTILRESLVLIDPLQNPDGRARFYTHTLAGRAARPDPEPAAIEHDEPWPGGRSNHYLFDMNRDWFAQSQPETRGRTRIYLEWYPQVVVDLHEMGGDSTYYFAPPADPLNPHISKQQAALLDLFGRENARRFDERGFSYFIREVFDSFYPGYGESWPLFHGSVGMTYEQASTRGLIWRREDDTTLTYREAILHHFTAGLATAETAARNRERLLREFYEYRRTALQEGERGPVREYLVPPGPDAARSRRLARLIASQGIEVRVSQEPSKVADRELPAGTYVFPLAQPASRLLRNLMDPDTRQPEDFVKEQDRRRKKRLPDQIYDITAWSLPQVFDVEVVSSDRPTGARSASSAPPDEAPAAVLPPAKVAYLIPWGSGAAGAVVEALQARIRVRTADRPFTIGGRKYAVGTAIIRTADHDAGLPAGLGAIAARHGAEVIPIDTGYVEAGISLGSGEVVPLRAPRVLLLWDSPASSLSAGWTRYVLERRFGQSVTTVRSASLRRVDLRRFDVIVLPSGSYSATFGGDALRLLKDWIAAGGTLITLAEASRWASRESVGLLGTRTELRDGRPESDTPEKEAAKKGETPPKPIDLEKAIQPEQESPDTTPGALLRVHLDLEHWLSAGTDGTIQSIVEGRRVFTPLKLDKGRNVGTYAKKEQLVTGGLAWEESQLLLAQKAFLMHQQLGRGHIIAFAEDPNYRAFPEATQLLFINAVLLGPAH